MQALHRVHRRFYQCRRCAHVAAAPARNLVDKIQVYDHEVSGISLLQKNSSPIPSTADGTETVVEATRNSASRESQTEEHWRESVRQGYEQLRAIQNVGERNAEKLLAAGCTDRKSLAERLQAENVLDDDEQAVKFLKSVVGINRQDYAMSITREARRERSQWNRQMTMCVEGNISVGKTTFLEKVCDASAELQGQVQVVPEPIAQWTNTPNGQHNLLERFYRDPEQYGYMFQNFVFCTRVEQERCLGAQELPLRLLERSVFSDLQVFVRAGVQQKYLTPFERDVYLSSVQPIIKSVPSLQPDAFVYLRARPESCYQRLLQRSRAEEVGVGLDYLLQLHQYHEEWMKGDKVPPADTGGLNVIRFNGSGVPFHSTTEGANGERYEPEGQAVSLLGVPVLILDCEPDIVTDPDARQEYSRTLHAFWKYAAQQRTTRRDENASEANGHKMLNN